MAKFAKELITSLRQAAAHACGRKLRGVRVTRVEIPDVKAIRRSLRMSQNRFSAACRIPLATLKMPSRDTGLAERTPAFASLQAGLRARAVAQAGLRPAVRSNDRAPIAAARR